MNLPKNLSFEVWTLYFGKPRAPNFNQSSRVVCIWTIFFPPNFNVISTKNKYNSMGPSLPSKWKDILFWQKLNDFDIWKIWLERWSLKMFVVAYINSRSWQRMTLGQHHMLCCDVGDCNDGSVTRPSPKSGFFWRLQQLFLYGPS